MQKIKDLIAEYGRVALVVYLSIYAVTMAVIVSTIVYGAGVESTAGIWATLGAAYVASRASLPLRILGTVALTPLVAKVFGKGKKVPPGTPQADPGPPQADPAPPAK